MRIRATKGGRQHFRRHLLAFLVCLPIARVPAEGTGEQGAGDTTRKRCGPLRIIFCGVVPQCGHQLMPRVGVELLGYR
jgi:hypothetical protein